MTGKTYTATEVNAFPLHERAGCWFKCEGRHYRLYVGPADAIEDAGFYATTAGLREAALILLEMGQA